MDRINADIAAAACEVVALAITKLAFEGPIILKGFSAYICGDDDDLAQLELKNQRLPLPFRPSEFYAHYSSQISLVIIAYCRNGEFCYNVEVIFVGRCSAAVTQT
jgi:hypothetical protein